MLKKMTITWVPTNWLHYMSLKNGLVQKIDSGGNTLVVAAYFCWFDSLYNIINEKCICNILLQAITNEWKDTMNQT